MEEDGLKGGTSDSAGSLSLLREVLHGFTQSSQAYVRIP
jgi:hypothetical protein